MDRRLAENTDLVRFRVDATRCDGQGVCVLVAPELFELDRYGLAFVAPGGDQLAASDPDVRASGLEADAMCPRNAIREELASSLRRTIERETFAPQAFAPRLVLPGDRVETLDEWRAAGGLSTSATDELLELIDAAGIVGHGGAGFPAAEKWRRVVGADQPIVVANGSEREPGTEKDRYLMTHRPALVLDGLRLAMHAVGATLGFICIDEDAQAAADAMAVTLDAMTGSGLLDGCQIRFQRVPTRYVAGEETALLSVIEGGLPIPRTRPPYPSDVGLFGRATLVQNVETLAQLAVAVAIGPAAYRGTGTPDCPGSGVFSIGPFGGPFAVTEIEFGRSLRTVLDEHGLLEGAMAVLVGGYAGGLLTPDSLDVALTPDALRTVSASLGTKSVQVLSRADCPVRVTAEIVRYFGEQTADQCPPCSRGLPDMAAILDDLEKGAATQESLADLERFMATLSGRGVCRLPDGAARLALSLLTNFADTVAAHASGGCGHR
jgi:NADH:ubiquinone oxidoreductase subunit F (NADH-binding)/ferredoxin